MSGEAVFVASDEAGVEAACRNARHAERELDRALLRVLESREGRVVVWWLLRELSGWFDRSFTGDATTYFNEGRREVGTRLVEKMLALNPAAFPSLITEMTEGKR